MSNINIQHWRWGKAFRITSTVHNNELLSWYSLKRFDSAPPPLSACIIFTRSLYRLIKTGSCGLVHVFQLIWNSGTSGHSFLYSIEKSTNFIYSTILAKTEIHLSSASVQRISSRHDKHHLPPMTWSTYNNATRLILFIHKHSLPKSLNLATLLILFHTSQTRVTYTH